MTFQEKYDSCKTWHEKVIVMRLFFLTMKHRDRKYTVLQMSKDTGYSLGLISENLKLAEAIDKYPRILEKCDSRQKALTYIRGLTL